MARRRKKKLKSIPNSYVWRKIRRWVFPYKLKNKIRRKFLAIMPPYFRGLHFKRYTKRKLWKFWPWSPQKKHAMIIWWTWSGKSTAMTFLWYHHINRTNKINKKGKWPLAFSLIEPHSDLSMDFLQFSCWEGDNKDRLIYLDADIRTTFYKLFREDVGYHDFVINPFEVSTFNANDHNAMVENLTAAFFSILRSKATERMESLIEAGVDLLLSTPWTSIVDLKNIMHDDTNESYVNQGMNLKNVERAEIFRNLRNNVDIKTTKNGIYYRLKSILSSPMLRSKLIWKSTVDMEKAINDGKVMIFNIWSLGKRSGTVYGKLLLALQQWIIRKRYWLSQYGRKPFLSYIDEADEYLSSPDAISDVLTKHRKFWQYQLLAFQSIAQIKDLTLREVILGNTAVKAFARLDSKSMSKMKSTIARLSNEDFEQLRKHTFLVHNQESGRLKKRAVPDMLIRKRKPFFLNKKELKELLLRTIYDSWYYHEIDPVTWHPKSTGKTETSDWWVDEHTGTYFPNFKS